MEGDINQKLLKEKKGAEVTVADEVTHRDRVWSETKKMWVVAGPAIFTRFSTFGINVISQAFIGHIGPTELAAYSIVNTVFLRFSNGILLGMASALETLCGQAYGAKQYNMLGVYLQRSWIVLFFASIFILPVPKKKNIAEVGGYVAYWSIGVMLSFIVSFTCQMFLQSQSKNMIIAYLAAFSIAIHILLSWLKTVKYKFGIPGVLLSTTLAYWIPNIGQLMFGVCGGCPETWKGFSSLAFKELWPFVKLSISSGVMLCLELWYNTVLILFTGNKHNAEVAIDALSICLNINGWEMMISCGFLAAASVRVSNELGRGSSKAAKFSIVITVLTLFAIGFVLFLFFLFFRGRLAYIFTESEEVAKAVANLSPLLAVSILLNRVAVGAGWQSIVAYVNIACYYLIGVPVGVVLGSVYNMEVKGIWIGMLFGTFVQTIVLTFITYKSDWDEQVILARNRVKKWVVKDSEEPNLSTSNS
ncbi:hypothetical protein ACB092_09G157200 [Castanea dentata]